jgi:hypothetical protein
VYVPPDIDESNITDADVHQIIKADLNISILWLSKSYNTKGVNDITEKGAEEISKAKLPLLTEIFLGIWCLK